jgi:hypothetical protein
MPCTCNAPPLIGLVKTLLKDQFFVNENLDISLKQYQFMSARTENRFWKNMNLELDKPNDLLRNKVLPFQILSTGTEVNILSIKYE